MSKRDRQKLSILVVLLAVLALTTVLGYRMTRPPTVSTAQASEKQAPKISVNLPPPDQSYIRLDLLEKSAEEGQGKRNLFQYQQAPPPPPPGPPRGGPPPNQPPPVTTMMQQPGPVGPPPPPPIPLKFQGFAITETPDRSFTAFIADDSRHYNVTVGETLMGRYRIVNITEKTVEVEDLQYNRRQTLPYLK